MGNTHAENGNGIERTSLQHPERSKPVHTDNKDNGIIRPRVHVRKPTAYRLGNVVIAVFPTVSDAMENESDVETLVLLCKEEHSGAPLAEEVA